MTSMKIYVEISMESSYVMFPAIMNVLHLEKQKNAENQNQHWKIGQLDLITKNEAF